MKTKPISEIDWKDWIETCLDADAHGTWQRAPNFDIIQDVAELMAPRIQKRLEELLLTQQTAHEEELKKAIKTLRWKYSNDLSLDENDLIHKLETLDDLQTLSNKDVI